MLVEDRDTGRRYFVEAWRKFRMHAPMEPMEELVASIIARHPEYHRLLEDEQKALAIDGDPAGGQENPFLHLSLHVALLESLATDRPPGIVALHAAARARQGDVHVLEHRMMECLAEILWLAQQRHALPDQERYLECLKRRLSDRS